MVKVKTVDSWLLKSWQFTVWKWFTSAILQTLCSCLQNPHFRKTNTGYLAGPGLESYLKGFNFTGEPPWALYSWGTTLHHVSFLVWALVWVSTLNWLELNSFPINHCVLSSFFSATSLKDFVRPWTRRWNSLSWRRAFLPRISSSRRSRSRPWR